MARRATLHSGVFGGALENPAMALCRLLGSLRDAKGRVTIPGFYDGILPLSKYERAQAAKFPLSDQSLKKLLGVPELFGERGFTPMEQRAARPTFEINGLTSGYQGKGSKTIVPAWASAKITCRLVPNQDPAHRSQNRLRPPEKNLSADRSPGDRRRATAAEGVFCIADERHGTGGFARAQKFLRAAEPILMREGGSIPIVNEVQKNPLAWIRSSWVWACPTTTHIHPMRSSISTALKKAS